VPGNPRDLAVGLDIEVVEDLLAVNGPIEGWPAGGSIIIVGGAVLHQNLPAVILPESSSAYLSTLEGKLTVIPRFNLRVYQNPTGAEFRALERVRG
jgi:hypothetical protein